MMPILVYDCPHCGAKQMTHTLWGSRARSDLSLTYAGMQCQGCRDVTIATLTQRYVSREKPESVSDIADSFNLLGVRPSPPVVGAPYGTPDAVAKRFVEAVKNFTDQRWNSAVGMFRSALDIATKHLAPDHANKPMAKRIDAMVTAHKLPAAMGEWAHQVRIEGNDALHDPDEFTEADAAPLHRFAQMFLVYAYEMPQRVIDARATP